MEEMIQFDDHNFQMGWWKTTNQWNPNSSNPWLEDEINVLVFV